MRLLLDEHLSKSLLRFLLRQGHDAVRVVDVGLRGASDGELLLWAKVQGRITISRDPDFLNDILYPPEPFAGMIVLRTGDESPRATVEAVKLVLARLNERSIKGKLVIVDDEGLRVRPDEW